MFNECLEIRCKTAHFCILYFSFQNHFVWDVISSIQHGVSSPDETPWSLSKILHCASYFQLSSQYFMHLVMKHCFSCLIYYLNNPILSHYWGVPSWKYELTAEIISGNVCRNNGIAPAWVWAPVNQFQKHFLGSLLLHVLQSFTQGFQSTIQEENMAQLGWYHLCKNDYFSFSFSLGDSPLSYFWILCWRLSKSLLLLREYLKKYCKIKVPENDDVNL